MLGGIEELYFECTDNLLQMAWSEMCCENVFPVYCPCIRSFLTDQGIFPMIGSGNPSCISITGALNATLFNGRETQDNLASLQLSVLFCLFI